MSEYNFQMEPGNPPTLNFNYECCPSCGRSVVAEKTIDVPASVVTFTEDAEGNPLDLQELDVEVILPKGESLSGAVTLTVTDTLPVGSTVVLRGKGAV